MWNRTLLALLLVIGICPDSADADKIQPMALGSSPLCEASAVLQAPWDPEVVLVADNEEHGQLFAFTLGAGGLHSMRPLAMPDGERPRDIEALAQVGDAVLIVGSHSRNKRCEDEPKRQRLRIVRWNPAAGLEATAFLDGSESWDETRTSEGKCRKALFTKPRPAGADDVCEALVAAENAAGTSSGCDVLNIEGAVGAPDGRVWLGLRAPLVNGRAILLRLAEPLEEIRFDRVVLLDLDRRGIRELTLAGDRVFGVAGPTFDTCEPFVLWSIALADLDASGTIGLQLIRQDLPTSSEGLAVISGRAVIAVDGDQGDDNGECAQPSRQYTLNLR